MCTKINYSNISYYLRKRRWSNKMCALWHCCCFCAPPSVFYNINNTFNLSRKIIATDLQINKTKKIYQFTYKLCIIKFNTCARKKIWLIWCGYATRGCNRSSDCLGDNSPYIYDCNWCARVVRIKLMDAFFIGRKNYIWHWHETRPPKLHSHICVYTSVSFGYTRLHHQLRYVLKCMSRICAQTPYARRCSKRVERKYETWTFFFLNLQIKLVLENI